MYISDSCEWTPYGHDAALDKNLDSCLGNEDKIKKFLEQNKNYGLDMVFNYIQSHREFKAKYLKRYIADQGYGLDKFINDEDVNVRCAVAKQGYSLDILVNDEDEDVRAAVAEQSYGLDKLINDKDSEVRAAVAEQGYGLDILINDENEWVRYAVAEQGYGLDKLINDKDTCVRSAVARQGYGLDILINDKEYAVRIGVAKHGYGLDKLINDDSDYVRQGVAEHGYGLDILVNDESKWVRRTVSYYLEDNGYKSIFDWAKANPDKVYSNIESETINTIKDFIYKVDSSNTLKVESSYESIDAFFDDESEDSNRFITILTVDTKVPLIKLERAVKNKKQVYKFIVDITNDNNSFEVSSIISSKSKFNQLLESVINALSELPQFSKYADDLKNCL